MYNCPAGPTTHEFQNIGEQHSMRRQWGWLDLGANCKYVIKANARLNGKIVVEIQKVRGVNMYLYLQPNHFNSKKYGTHGILENNKIYKNVVSGKYTVPTDWSIWLVYNPRNVGGHFKVKAYTTQFEKRDEWYIKNDWRPTGTSYVDQEREKQLKAEKAMKEAEILENLKKE